MVKKEKKKEKPRLKVGEELWRGELCEMTMLMAAIECRDGHSQQAGGCRRALPPNQGEEPYRAGPKRSSLVCRLKVDSRFVRRML